MFMHAVDFVKLFFEDVLLVMLAAVETRAAVAFNLINLQNAVLVRLLLRGLRDVDVVTLVLSDEAVDAQRVGRHKDGNELLFGQLSWPHVHATHMLVRGLDFPQLSPDALLARLRQLPPAAVVDGSARAVAWSSTVRGGNESGESPEAAVTRHHVLLEIYPLTFVELHDSQPALLWDFVTTLAPASRANGQALSTLLECRGATRACTRTHGNAMFCSQQLLVAETDAAAAQVSAVGDCRGGRPAPARVLSAGFAFDSFVARPPLLDRLQPGDTPAVIVFYGSLAPMHTGHLETLELARRELEARGLVVVGGYCVPIRFPHHRFTKSGWFPHLTPWRHRARIVRCSACDGVC